jgi:hypothetical protein
LSACHLPCPGRDWKSRCLGRSRRQRRFAPIQERFDKLGVKL